MTDRSRGTPGAQTLPPVGGCTRSARQRAHADAGWVTTRIRQLKGTWVAIYAHDGELRTRPVSHLVLQLHSDRRSRVVPAHLDGGHLVLLDEPTPTTCVPEEVLELFVDRIREQQCRWR